MIGSRCRSENLRLVDEVVAAIDRPEIPRPDPQSAQRIVARHGQQEAALARLRFQRVVEPGKEEDGNACRELAVVGLGAIARDDVELRTAQPPPRLRQGAVGDPAVVQDVAVLVALGPFAFEMKRRAGGRDPGLGW